MSIKRIEREGLPIVIDAHTEIIREDAITGGDAQSDFLYYQLKLSMAAAARIDIIVSFLMESGVRLLIDDLRSALERGAQIRILTGDYLGITQPSALYMIKRELGDKIDLRFYQRKDCAFHPKAYLFHHARGSEIYIGSSNISRSALTNGIEWNYHFTSERDPDSCRHFYETFESLFLHHASVIDDDVLKQYAANWHQPAVMRDLEKYSRDGSCRSKLEEFVPRGAQIEALYALENARNDGAARALVVAATGIGKTYLAAFDSAPFHRVLFVAHREEILRQAAQTFQNVRHTDHFGFFSGDHKDTEPDLIFASVQTLGREKYLKPAYFSPRRFDYIVIDECHHMAADMYRRIIAYFRPEFLLALTATPERMDGRDIFALCDYNVPYELSLKDAINRGMLAPFHYYGIYDDIDYSKLHYRHGRYDEHELSALYLEEDVHRKRSELIIRHFLKYAPKSAIGFCCSRQHAAAMARIFTENGIKSCAVFSGSQGENAAENRESAIQKLKNGSIRAIFCVDMFNEGVDIPGIDTVMFLRPTESPVVFLQQLGRGLRKNQGKNWLTVLDFIGNYKNASKIPRFLSGARHSGDEAAFRTPVSADFPDGCLVDFDIRLIDMFRLMESRNLSVQDRIREEYFRIKEKNGDHPLNRTTFFIQMDRAVFELCRGSINPFAHYLDFLHELNELTEDELTIYHTAAREFLCHIENTAMTRVYKMPVLRAFIGDGFIKKYITDSETLASWKDFFSTGTNWKDCMDCRTHADFCQKTDRQHLKCIMTNPVKFLLKSGKGFFETADDGVLAISKPICPYLNHPAFVKHYCDIVEYRTLYYYWRRYSD